MINEQIRDKEVRLIGEDGEQLGVMSSRDAMRLAEEAELDLIIAAGCRSYPPRLPGQPIFYPVLNEKYAREIAEKWNKKSADSGYSGYVTTFEVSTPNGTILNRSLAKNFPEKILFFARIRK